MSARYERFERKLKPLYALLIILALSLSLWAFIYTVLSAWVAPWL
jgi:fatty acid desaturase